MLPNETEKYATEAVNKKLSIEMQSAIWTLYQELTYTNKLDESIKQPFILEGVKGIPLLKSKNTINTRIRVPNVINSKVNSFVIRADINMHFYEEHMTLAVVKSDNIYILCFDNEDLAEYGI